MEKTVAISLDEMLREVYATSALRSYLASDSQLAPFLNPDHRTGLAVIAEEVFSEFAMRMIAYLSEVKFPTDSASGNFELTFKVPDDVSLPVALIRKYVEKWMALQLMARLARGYDSTAEHGCSTAAEARLLTLAGLLAGPAPIQVKPCG